MKAKNFKNERPDYSKLVLLLPKAGKDPLIGFRKCTDERGHVYLSPGTGIALEKSLMGWMPIPTEVDEVFPTAG